MEQTPGGILVPATPSQAADPDFWRDHALNLQVKLQSLQTRVETAEQSAVEARQQAAVAARQQAEQVAALARTQSTAQPEAPVVPDHGPALVDLDRRLRVLEDAPAPAPVDHGDEIAELRLAVQQLQALHGLNPTPRS